MINYYSILQIANFSSLSEVKKAFRKLAIIYHPDKYDGSTDKFLSIYEAYSFLSDINNKKDYDERLGELLKNSKEVPPSSFIKFKNEEFQKKKEAFQSFNSDELDVFFRIIKGKIPDLFFSFFLLGIGGFFIIMSFSAPESIIGTLLGLALGTPLAIVGIRDVSLVLKIKDFKKTYPIIRDA